MAFLLSQVKEIYVPPKKELFFFDFNFQRGLDWYERHCFSGVMPHQLPCDATPWYMSWSDDVPGRIHSAYPEAKIVFILRDPSARAWSHYWHDFSSLYLDLKVLPRQYFESNDDGRRIKSCSMYFLHLQKWLIHFPPSQILVCPMDCLKNDPLGLLRDILKFLNCGSRFSLDIPARIDAAPRMLGKAPRGVLSLSSLQFIQGKSDSLFNFLASKINRHPRLKYLFFSNKSVPLESADRVWLDQIFRDDYSALCDWLSIDPVRCDNPFLLSDCLS